MDPPSALLCDLRPYQKQALHWMIHLEKGKFMDEAATTLHPCWEGSRLADEYASFSFFIGIFFSGFMIYNSLCVEFMFLL